MPVRRTAFNLTATATGYWLLATGYWLLATGYWLRPKPRAPAGLQCGSWGFRRRRSASLARLVAAALAVLAAVAVLRAGQGTQTPPPAQQAPPAAQQTPPPAAQAAPPPGQQQPAQQPPVFRGGREARPRGRHGHRQRRPAGRRPHGRRLRRGRGRRPAEGRAVAVHPPRRQASRGRRHVARDPVAGTGRGGSRPRRCAGVRDLPRRLPHRQGAADHDPDAPGADALRQPPVAHRPGGDHGPAHAAERAALHALASRRCWRSSTSSRAGRARSSRSRA